VSFQTARLRALIQNNLLYIDALYNGLYSPTDWPQLAKKLRGMGDFLANPNSTEPFERRSVKRSQYQIRRQNEQNDNQNNNGNNGNSDNLNENKDPPRTDYNFQAIACADAADPGNITTKVVFDSLVNSSRTASPICE
jgi:hypothetical protein